MPWPPRAEPYERNYRIRLLLRVLGVEADVRVGMQDPSPGNPMVDDRPEPCPRHPVPLTSAPKRVKPTADRLASERVQADEIAGHPVIVEVPLHHASQPLPKLPDRFVAPPEQRTARAYS